MTAGLLSSCLRCQCPRRAQEWAWCRTHLEAVLQDEAGDTKLEFTKTPGPWETEVSRSCNHATDHSQGNGATELETEGLPASPPTSANEAIEEEGRTQPNKALPPAGCMDTSFSLQGGSNFGVMTSYPSVIGTVCTTGRLLKCREGRIALLQMRQTWMRLAVCLSVWHQDMVGICVGNVT